MRTPEFSVVAAVRRTFALRPRLRWTAEVTDPASPLAGLTACGRSPEGARRALATQVAMALVEDETLQRTDEVDVEVVSWQAATYGVTIPTID